MRSIFTYGRCWIGRIWRSGDVAHLCTRAAAGQPLAHAREERGAIVVQRGTLRCDQFSPRSTVEEAICSIHFEQVVQVVARERLGAARVFAEYGGDQILLLLLQLKDLLFDRAGGD